MQIQAIQTLLKMKPILLKCGGGCISFGAFSCSSDGDYLLSVVFFFR